MPIKAASGCISLYIKQRLATIFNLFLFNQKNALIFAALASVAFT